METGEADPERLRPPRASTALPPLRWGSWNRESRPPRSQDPDVPSSLASTPCTRAVLIPLIQSYQPSGVLACDVAEQMLQRVQHKHPTVCTFHTDIVSLALASTSLDAIFMNAMYGNIADKLAARGNAARMLRSGGRLVVSHPEGRAFVDQLRATSDLFIESLPTKEEFEVLLEPLGLEVFAYRDEPKLYLMVARKS